MEYNVENLFDTIHAEGKNDLEFTPQGDHHWNERRYWGKLGRLCRVIAGAGGETPVDLVALVEVENDSVVSNLTRRTKLTRLGYEYLTANTADERGIRVALLYQPFRFKLVGSASIRFARAKNLGGTRDALHVAGELTTGDTLDLIVCHWPSRRAAGASAKYRETVARRLRSYCDSLMKVRERPYLILTGDFNAWYPERSLREALGVRLPEDSINPCALYILSHGLHTSDGIEGTYKYQGEWNQLDQFIVNGALLKAPSVTTDRNKEEETDNEAQADSAWTADSACTNEAHRARLHTSAKLCRIVDFPFLLQKEKNGNGLRPYRTYLGTYYQGGYSDHLPLILDLYY